MQYYPMKLKGITKSPIWGGTRLRETFGKLSDCETIGESWELTVREKEMCTVENGAFSGRTLGALIAGDVAGMMGESRTENGFPLLIKLIDAHDRLSVQVHPDDAYAARVEHDRGKTEMWYIVEAEEGAEIICGLAAGMTQKDFAEAVAAGDPERALHRQKVHPGETYFIPAGLPHAIGRGILIAEIQQNCDLTYRVYDYNRRQADGSLRELHVRKALEVIRPFSAEEIERIRFSRGNAAPDVGVLLADCEYFRVVQGASEPGKAVLLPPSARMRHLLFLSGSGTVHGGGVDAAYTKGDSIFLPAELGEVSVEGTGIWLLSEAY